jgi:hypothetical protein
MDDYQRNEGMSIGPMLAQWTAPGDRLAGQEGHRQCQDAQNPDMLNTMARLKLTLVLDSGARLGPGKAMLLESVRATGSISAAARAMGMDYKRAWHCTELRAPAFARLATSGLRRQRLAARLIGRVRARGQVDIPKTPLDIGLAKAQEGSVSN